MCLCLSMSQSWGLTLWLTTLITMHISRLHPAQFPHAGVGGGVAGRGEGKRNSDIQSLFPLPCYSSTPINLVC